MRDYFLQTGRIGFSRWSESDFPLALMLWGDPQVTELIDARPSLTHDDVRERLESEIALYNAHVGSSVPSAADAGSRDR